MERPEPVKTGGGEPSWGEEVFGQWMLSSRNRHVTKKKGHSIDMHTSTYVLCHCNSKLFVNMCVYIHVVSVNDVLY